MMQQQSMRQLVLAGVFLMGGVIAVGAGSLDAQKEVTVPATTCGLYGGSMCSKTTTCVKLMGTDTERCTTSYAYYRG